MQKGISAYFYLKYKDIDRGKFVCGSEKKSSYVNVSRGGISRTKMYFPQN